MRWCSTPRLPLLLFLAFLLLIGRSSGKSPGFKICAFNTLGLNAAKAANSRVTHTLTRIVSRCDITLLQEVKDSGGSAVRALEAALNRYDQYHYQSVSSAALGNDPKDMQQYVFIYRTETVNVTAQHQYRKPQSFVREPFAVRFRSNKTATKDFVLVALHTVPEKAVQEIDRLYDVFQEVSKKWNTQNVMFLGDFNAGCAHMTRANKRQIRLFSQPGFFWLIGDKVDTTVGDGTNCPYDRIVVYGEPFLKTIKPYSAKAFNFPKEFRLQRERALKVSDHLPVEVELNSSAHLCQATPLLLLLLCVIAQSCLSAL
ncbi:deoxyribonuclease-1-like 1 isoform X2 [Myripristis murdjan]|uniref:Deoxyribonuclease n=1 Tax=Myripristis murdjan TaxID=586833 RepID=A0A667X8A2_9TELE|nr:deoxyribonuclease-1-like 1 isoform X2 [Myripristis murdjan]